MYKFSLDSSSSQYRPVSPGRAKGWYVCKEGCRGRGGTDRDSFILEKREPHNQFPCWDRSNTLWRCIYCGQGQARARSRCYLAKLQILLISCHLLLLKPKADNSKYTRACPALCFIKFCHISGAPSSPFVLRIKVRWVLRIRSFILSTAPGPSADSLSLDVQPVLQWRLFWKRKSVPMQLMD